MRLLAQPSPRLKAERDSMADIKQATREDVRQITEEVLKELLGKEHLQCAECGKSFIRTTLRWRKYCSVKCGRRVAARECMRRKRKAGKP